MIMTYVHVEMRIYSKGSVSVPEPELSKGQNPKPEFKVKADIESDSNTPGTN